MAQYDEIGEAYIKAQQEAKMPHEAMGNRFLLDVVTSKRPNVIVDLGCGHGPDLATYSSIAAVVIGVDESTRMLNHAAKNAPSAQLIRADCTSTKITTSTVDMVVSRFGVHYVRDMGAVYSECARILRPGGLLAFVLPHPTTQFLQSPSRVYGMQETFDIPIYRGTFSVKCPTHTLEDYLSPEFLSKFVLTDLKECVSGETKAHDCVVPDLLAIVAVKR